MVGMLGRVSMSAPGSGGSQRAHGLEHIWAYKANVVYIFPVPASPAALTRTTHDPVFLNTLGNALKE